MVPLDGPHNKKTEGARAKAAPLATPVAAKRTTSRSKPARTSKPAVIDDSRLELQVSAVVAAEATVPADEIRLCAYYKWEAAGRPEGDGLDFWLDAERELLSGL